MNPLLTKKLGNWNGVTKGIAKKKKHFTQEKKKTKNKFF